MSSKYTAIIIEPREHKALPYVLHNFLENLSDEWSIIIFHGKKNVEYVNNIVSTLDEKYKNRILKLVNLNVYNLNAETYAIILKSEDFYRHIPTDTFLIFQTDSIILKENKDLLNDFLHYDYVGAPWRHIYNLVGNGGLSIRKKSKMLEIIKNKGYIFENEDLYFSLNIDSNIHYNVPTGKIASKFSVESIYNDSPFGIHNCWRALRKNDMNSLIKKYPEIQTLIDLQ
jgi:hypothetical protein